jgi:hypothetical protein
MHEHIIYTIHYEQIHAWMGYLSFPLNVKTVLALRGHPDYPMTYHALQPFSANTMHEWRE